MAGDHRSTRDSLRLTYRVVRGSPIVDEIGRTVVYSEIEPGTGLDAEQAKARCLEWRNVYPDAIVVQSVVF